MKSKKKMIHILVIVVMFLIMSLTLLPVGSVSRALATLATYGNATAGDLLFGKTATVDAGQIEGAIPNKVGSQTVITPGAVDQEIPQGYYGGAVADGKVVGDPNLIPSNIVSGVSIFGITGTAAGNASGTAVASDVLEGKTFSNDNDSGLVGTMTNQGGMIITPDTANQSIPSGSHDGTGYVVGDVDLVSSNLKKDANIFGVIGTFGQSTSSRRNTYTSAGVTRTITLGYRPRFIHLRNDQLFNNVREILVWNGSVILNSTGSATWTLTVTDTGFTILTSSSENPLYYWAAE